MADADIDDELFALAGGDEEAEEGEASSVAASSPGHDSLGSGVMEESDSESEADNANNYDDAVPYPLEGKYKNEKDRQMVNAMPQIDREQLLAERAEEAEQRKFKEELARRAKQIERDNINLTERKRKAGSAELDDSQRKSSRQKTKPTSAIEAYKREREQRGELRKRQNDRRDRGRRSSSEDKAASDIDAEGESEVEWEEKRAAPAREEAPANLTHFESVRVGRALFQKVCFYPGFDEAMIGCFARIGVGQDSMRRTLYKMAVIIGFTTGKPYVFEGKGDTKVATDQYVVAKHGTVKKEYNFSFLSNGHFTDEDLDTYKRTQLEQNLKIPSRSALEQKYNDIKALENRTWTDHDIQAKITRQNQYRHLVHAMPVKESPVKFDSAAQRLADINKANRKKDSEQIRRALIEERRATKREREARERAAKEKAEAEAKSKLLQVPTGIDDLFEGSDRSRSGTPAVMGKGSGRNTPAKTEKKGGLPTFKKKTMDDDIISSMDLGIEIDF